jgi:hypothetical protein
MLSGQCVSHIYIKGISLSKNKLPPPNITKLASNFGEAMVGYIKSGFKHVSTEEYKERLDICQNCNNYNKGRCEHPECGCFVAAKAWIESEDCPKNKWPQTEK